MLTTGIQNILKRYPKKRPVLPTRYQNIYHLHYSRNRTHTGVVGWLTQKLERWMHLRVADDLNLKGSPAKTLEIGAGTLNHLIYENMNHTYDIVEPYKALYLDSPYIHRVNTIYNDMSEVFGKYDRIISIATFEHIHNLPYVMAMCGLLLKPEGVLRVAIPSQGSLAWKLAYTLSTGIVFRIKYNLRYELLMRYEHINTWQEIHALLGYFYTYIHAKYLGLSPRLSLYHFYECKDPIVLRCQEYGIG